MSMVQNVKYAKFAAPFAVLVVALLTFVGVSYAYSATYTDSFEGQETGEEYVIITGSHTATVPQKIDAVWNTTTTSTSLTATYAGGHFVKDLGTAGGAEITTVTYRLATITVTKYDDDHPTGQVVNDLTATNFTITLTNENVGGKTKAVTGTPTYTVKEIVNGETKTGQYAVDVTFTLISLENTAAAASAEYIIPGYDVSIVYNVAETA